MPSLTRAERFRRGSRLLSASPGPERHDEVGEAAAVCPAAAVRLVEQ
ncbi:hypothetical protein [Actinoplanes cyaneus]|nr:hypothetical protein [Actinoplanes cyaneus]